MRQRRASGAKRPTPTRGFGERLAAWLYTGPLGHFWSTAADLGSYFVRTLAQRMLPGSGSRSSARR